MDRDPTVPKRLTRAFLEAARMPIDLSNVHAASYEITAAEQAAAVGADFLPASVFHARPFQRLLSRIDGPGQRQATLGERAGKI